MSLEQPLAATEEVENGRGVHSEAWRLFGATADRCQRVYPRTATPRESGYTRGVPKLSVTIITLNEARNIEAALASVSWADEVIVVDSGSRDDTVGIATRFGARVSQRDWPGYGAQKDHAASLATHEWVLSLDADERVTPELAAEIQEVLGHDPPCFGYRMPRTTRYLGQWLRTTDFYPDHQLRLYDRRTGRWSRASVHESVQVDGAVGTLRHDLRHHPYSDLAAHVRTINHYSTLAAAAQFARGRRAGVLDLLVRPPLAFARNYLLRLGCLQGVTGLVVSIMNAHYVFLKQVKLRELGLRAGREG